MMNIQKAITGTMATAGLAMVAMGAAHASLAPTNFTVSGGGPYTFTYDASLNNNEKVASGDFLTISGFNGFVPGTAGASNAGFSAVATGGDPTSVTYTYTGAGLTAPTALQFFFQSTVKSVDLINFNEQDTSSATGNKLTASGTIEGPAGTPPAAVPEPGAMVPFAFGGLGVLGLMIRARKNRR